MILPPGKTEGTLTARVAVVGSGPAGLAIAMSLARSGLDVVVMESGRERNDAFASSLAAAAEMPELHAKLEEISSRRFGGASWLWGGRCVTFDPIDFERRPHAEAPGWPIERDEALRKAEAAAEFLGIGRAAFAASPIPSLGTDRIDATLERWSVEPQLARRHFNAVQESRAMRAYLGLTCVGATIDATGRVEALEARSATGGCVRVVADAYVIAAGGIETARLLLWMFEKLPAHAKPRWLGRGYMGHLSGTIARIAFARDIFGELDYRREETAFVRRRLLIQSALLRSEELLNIGFHIDNPVMRDPHHGSASLSALVLALATPGLAQILAPAPVRQVLLRGPLTLREAAAHLVNVSRAPWTAAAFGLETLRGRLSRPRRPGVIERNRHDRYALRFSAEQAARFDSRVRLSTTLDSLGVPRVIIEPRIDEYDVRSVIRAHDILGSELQRLGLARLEYQTPRPDLSALIRAQSGDGYHQIGLARMGDVATTSVVDRDARVHGFANLFIAGSAVFPTSSRWGSAPA